MTQDNEESEDEDEFWKVALENEESDCPLSTGSDRHDDIHARPALYHLPISERESVLLRLSSLPMDDGIWSPLGAQAWYGSALLSAILLLKDGRIHKHLDLCKNVNVLELGSGAVGLSGLAMALVLGQKLGDHHLYLTDNEPSVLHQLQANVSSNVERISKEHPHLILPHISVEYLDWHSIDESLLPDQLQLVIGSELIYTFETAEACANCVELLLTRHSQVLIAIVQVTDRDGWENIFLPRIRQRKGVSVEIESINWDWNDVACRMIRHGGTFDRFDFVLCYIYKH